MSLLSLPSPAVARSPLPEDPAHLYRRALRYWYKTGRLDFFEQYRTGALTHSRTRTRAHPSNSAPVNWQKQSLYIQKDPAYPMGATDGPHGRPHSGIDPGQNSDQGCDSEGRRPYWMNGLVSALREERESLHITPKDYGHRWRSGYVSFIGERPICNPGDHTAAQLYWYRITQALDMEGWSPSERTRLRALERKWKARKDGQDARFEIMGNVSGGPDPDQRRRIHDLRIFHDIIRLAKGGRF